MAFKENVSDLRNTRVIGIVRELQDYGMDVLVTDSLVTPEAAVKELAIGLVEPEALRDLDALVSAVPHRVVKKRYIADLVARIKPGGVLMDVKSALDPATVPTGLTYWRL